MSLLIFFKLFIFCLLLCIPYIYLFLTMRRGALFRFVVYVLFNITYSFVYQQTNGLVLIYYSNIALITRSLRIVSIAREVRSAGQFFLFYI